MSDLLTAVSIGLLYLGTLSLPLISAVLLVARIRSGYSRMHAALAHFALSLAPAAAFTAFFFALVGLEELTGHAVVPEGLARGFVIVVALSLLFSLLATIAFSIFLAVRMRPANPPS